MSDGCPIHGNEVSATECLTTRCGACANVGDPTHTLSPGALCVEAAARRSVVPVSRFHCLPSAFVDTPHRCGCARYLPNDAFEPGTVPWLPSIARRGPGEGKSFVLITKALFHGAMMDLTYSMQMYMEPTPTTRPFRRLILQNGVKPQKDKPIKLLSAVPQPHGSAPALLPFQEQVVRKMLERTTLRHMAAAVVDYGKLINAPKIDGEGTQGVVLFPPRETPRETPIPNVDTRYETHAGFTEPVETIVSSLPRPQMMSAMRTLLSRSKCSVGGQLVLPTGYGKTVIGATFLRRLRAKQSRTDASKRPFLVVCPPIVVPVWLEHLERYAPAMRVVANTAGGRRGGKGSTNPDTKTMETADVVVTTYSCVSRRAALRNVEEWGGVLLDENHLAPRSGTFTTWLSSCKARCKWGLSADRAAVRQSVFTMLRNPVTFFGGRIVDCIDFDACWTVAPKLEYEDGTPLLSLPAPTLVQHTLPFASSDERLMYRQIGAHVVEAWRSRPPDSLFWMVNRALSYHPFKAADLLVGPGGADPLEACLTTDMSKALKLDGDAGQRECAVCMSPLAHAVAPAGCSHAFCKPCLAAWMRRNDSCPLCRSSITQVRLVTIDNVVVGGPSATDDVKGGGLSTTKLAAVMDLITGGREGDKFLLGASSPASVMAMVDMLNSVGVKTVGISKLHPPAVRLSAVKDFNSNPDTSVMVLEYEFAGFGLSLTAANHVVVMETLLPRDMRAQFVGRAQRLGQTRQVTVHTMAVEGTVETSGFAPPATSRRMPHVYIRRFVSHLQATM